MGKKISSDKFTKYEFAGVYISRLEHLSQGFDSEEDAHNALLSMCTESAYSGNACEFVVSKSRDREDEIVYRARVLKTMIVYSIFKSNKVNKIINLSNYKNKLIMKKNERFTEQEMKFLGLSVEAAKKIAAKCVECVYDNIDKGDTAVSKAVDKISKGLVTISLKNKAGKQTEDHVCLQQWDLYAKTHCGKFLELPVESKKYNRINGTVNVKNLEEKIIEVYTKGNELLKKISDSDSIMQSATDVHKEIKNAKESKAKSQPCNTNTVDNTSSVQSKQVIVNANELVETVARTIVAYNNISNASLSILGVESLDNLIESKSMGLLSASIEENKITISCANSESTVIITTDNSEDSLYNDLYNAVAEQLIEMSFVDYTTIASIVDMKTIACLHKTLLTRYAASTENNVAPHEEIVDDSSMKLKQSIDAPIKDAEKSVPLYSANSPFSTFSVPQYTLKSYNTAYENMYISVPRQQMRKAS